MSVGGDFEDVVMNLAPGQWTAGFPQIAEDCTCPPNQS
jgi:hypothetical protein